jgi:hypothetical protein
MVSPNGREGVVRWWGDPEAFDGPPAHLPALWTAVVDREHSPFCPGPALCVTAPVHRREEICQTCKYRMAATWRSGEILPPLQGL